MATCPHGFPQGECLICQTLGKGPAGPSTRAKAKERPVEKTNPLKGMNALGPALLAPQATGRVPATGGPADRSAVRHRRGTAWTVLAALVIGGVLVWAFAGLFTLAFHIAEYVVLAVVAGWAGHKIGYARGRRHRE